MTEKACETESKNPRHATLLGHILPRFQIIRHNTFLVLVPQHVLWVSFYTLSSFRVKEFTVSFLNRNTSLSTYFVACYGRWWY